MEDLEKRINELKKVLESLISREEATASKLNQQSYFRGKVQAFREAKALLDLIC